MTTNLDEEGARNPVPSRTAGPVRGDQEKKDRSVLWQVLGLAWDLGYIIAIPLVLLALGGRLLDKRFSTSPLFLLVGIFVSLNITFIGLFRKIKVMMKDIDSRKP